MVAPEYHTVVSDPNDSTTPEDRAERLKTYLEANMEPGTKFEDGRAAIGWRKSTRVEVTNLDKIPLDFVKVIQEPRKTDIKQALQSGREMEGAELVTRTGISIR